MTDEERIVAAWDKAQVAFRAMLTAGVYGDANAPETRAYTDAERELDRELAEARWNRVKADLDTLIAASPAHDPDCDCYHINRQALEESWREAEGDHFAYPSAR